MKTFSLFEEFDVEIYDIDSWTYGSHKHSFFELVYILEGDGAHTINQNRYDYSKNDLYFLIPNDEHSFEIKTPTKMCLILFNKIYFSKSIANKNELADFTEIFKKIEFIFQNSNYLHQNFFKEKEQKLLIEQFVNNIVEEHNKRETFFEMVIQSNVITILCLIARKIRERFTDDLLNKGSDKDIADIIFYIQNNIYDNDKLSINHLAVQFLKSKNNLSTYFKSQTGFSIKDYILNYKLSLIKHRLLHSNLTVAEIAYELGFSDESHLNKLFKDRLQMTAKKFRQRIGTQKK